MLKMIISILLAILLGVIALSQLTAPICKSRLLWVVLLIILLSILNNVYDFTASENQQQTIDHISDKTDNIENLVRHVTQLLDPTAITRTGQWEEIKTIEKAVWLPLGVDYMMLTFKSISGSLRGRVRIKGSNQTYPFSTIVNGSIPVTIENVWLPERNQYEHFPVIQYEITEKSIDDAKIEITMVAVHVLRIQDDGTSERM